jgi:hypothetical protein
MGRQTRLECLTVEARFINGQMFIECLPAESRARPFTLHNVRTRGLTSYPQGVGMTILVMTGHPQVLSLTAGIHILPHKKYTLK